MVVAFEAGGSVAARFNLLTAHSPRSGQNPPGNGEWNVAGIESYQRPPASAYRPNNAKLGEKTPKFVLPTRLAGGRVSRECGCCFLSD